MPQSSIVPVPSAVIPVETVALDDQLWGVPSVFGVDWSRPVVLSSSWTTDVIEARNLTPTRAGLRGKPRRLLRAEIQGLSVEDNRQLRSAQFRAGMARSLVPLYCDADELKVPSYFVASYSSSGVGANAPTLLGTLALSTAGLTNFTLSNFTNDAVVVLTGPTDSVGFITSPPTINDGVVESLGYVNYSMPTNSIMFNATTGDLRHNGPYRREFTKPGGSTYTIPGSLDGTTYGIGVTANTISTSLTLSTTFGLISIATLASRGWVDSEGVARFRIWAMPSGTSSFTAEIPTPATLSVDAKNRRFFPGGRVLIAKQTDTPQKVEYDIGTIASVGDDFIALQTGLSRVYPVGSLVVPLIEGRPIMEGRADASTDETARWSYAVQEIVGPSALPPWEEQDATLDDFVTINGIPILDVVYNWQGNIDIGAGRVSIDAQSGITDVTKLKGSRPIAVGQLDFRFIDRASAARFLRFADSRRGRLYRFFLPSPATDLQFVSASGTQVVVKQSGQSQDWSFFPYLTVHLWDGTVSVRPITSVTRASGNDTINLTGSLSATVDQVRRVATASVFVFDSDEIVETWDTTDSMTVSIGVRESSLDKDVDIDVPDPTTGVTYDPSGTGPPGSGGGSGPEDGKHGQLYDCHGEPVNMFITVPPEMSGRICLYNPDDGLAYTVNLDQPVVVVSGPIIDGWQLIDCPPVYSADQPYVPECEGGPIFPPDDGGSGDPFVNCSQATATGVPGQLPVVLHVGVGGGQTCEGYSYEAGAEDTWSGDVYQGGSEQGTIPGNQPTYSDDGLASGKQYNGMLIYSAGAVCVEGGAGAYWEGGLTFWGRTNVHARYAKAGKDPRGTYHLVEYTCPVAGSAPGSFTLV